jgi:hypothetical protein
MSVVKHTFFVARTRTQLEEPKLERARSFKQLEFRLV